jgi:prolyl-tRNA synthetase
VWGELKGAGLRIKLDDREEVTPGFKFNDWEMRGVPLRIEVGPKDVESGNVTFARRDVPGKPGKTAVPQSEVVPGARRVLDEIQGSMLAQATAFRDANIHDPKSLEELKEVVQDGWAFSWWCGRKDCEARVKEETKATTRNIPFNQPKETGTCIVCGEPAEQRAYFARAY